MIVPYFPVVQTKTKQRFKISFTGEAVCKVRVGDSVVPSSIVFEGQTSEILQSINICKELGINRNVVRKHLLKRDGEIVEKGDIVARRSVAMGTAEKIVRSRHEGRISLENIGSGLVDIRAPFSDAVVPAGVHGKISKIYPDRGGFREMEFEVPGYAASAFKCVGPSDSGKLFILKDGTSVYRPSDVDGRCRGKIVVAGRSLSLGLYEALVEAGARGVIVGGMPLTEFREIHTPVIPVFISEGWGIIPVNKVLLALMAEYEGSGAYIDEDRNCLTVCPEELPPELNEGTGFEGSRVTACQLEKGMDVQVWDLPYWGYSGQILDIIEDDDLIKVGLPSGRKIIVDFRCVSAIGED